MHFGFTDDIYRIMFINMFQPQEEEEYNNCVCILLVTILKMVTLVAETCR